MSHQQPVNQGIPNTNINDSQPQQLTLLPSQRIPHALRLKLLGNINAKKAVTTKSNIQQLTSPSVGVNPKNKKLTDKDYKEKAIHHQSTINRQNASNLPPKAINQNRHAQQPSNKVNRPQKSSKSNNLTPSVSNNALNAQTNQNSTDRNQNAHNNGNVTRMRQPIKVIVTEQVIDVEKRAFYVGKGTNSNSKVEGTKTEPQGNKTNQSVIETITELNKFGIAETDQTNGDRKQHIVTVQGYMPISPDDQQLMTNERVNKPQIKLQKYSMRQDTHQNDKNSEFHDNGGSQDDQQFAKQVRRKYREKNARRNRSRSKDRNASDRPGDGDRKDVSSQSEDEPDHQKGLNNEKNKVDRQQEGDKEQEADQDNNQVDEAADYPNAFQLEAVLGFSSFGTSKHRPHTGSAVQGVFKNKAGRRKYRQYMYHLERPGVVNNGPGGWAKRVSGGHRN